MLADRYLHESRVHGRHSLNDMLAEGWIPTKPHMQGMRRRGVVRRVPHPGAPRPNRTENDGSVSVVTDPAFWGRNREAGRQHRRAYGPSDSAQACAGPTLDSAERLSSPAVWVLCQMIAGRPGYECTYVLDGSSCAAARRSRSGRGYHRSLEGSAKTRIALRAPSDGARVVGRLSAKAAIAPSIQPVTNQREAAAIRLVFMGRTVADGSRWRQWRVRTRTWSASAAVVSPLWGTQPEA
jgi:hypothetical protein